MGRIRPLLMIILPLIVSACLPQGTLIPRTTPDAGELVVYLQPLSQEAYNLRFTIGGISAMLDDGTERPLQLSFKEFKGSDPAGKQKRLAFGSLPPGSYTGLSIGVERAFLMGKDGEFALLPPPTPLIASGPFKVTRRGSLVLFLSFNGAGAVTAGVRFTPEFTLSLAGRQLASMTGYVSNSASNSLSVFNKKTMQVVGAISTGEGPKGMALDRKRNRVFVALSGSDAVDVIDIIEGHTVGRVTLNFGDEPVDLVLTPDGGTLLCVNHASNTVSIIDAFSFIEVRRINVGEKPVSGVISPSGRKAYIMNSRSGTISAVDLIQRTPTATLPVEGEPLQADFDRRGDKLYVISRDSPNLTVIEPAVQRVVAKIFIGRGARSIKTDGRTGLVLVGKSFGGEISVIDPLTRAFIDTIPVGGDAAHMTIDDEENTLFVLLPDRKNIQKINLTSKKLMGEIEVGEGGQEVVLAGER